MDTTYSNIFKTGEYNGVDYYMPENYDENTNIIVFAPGVSMNADGSVNYGDSGYVTETIQLREFIAQNPDSIVLVARNTHNWSETIPTALEGIKNTYFQDSEMGNVFLDGFSYSSRNVVSTGIKLAQATDSNGNHLYNSITIGVGDTGWGYLENLSVEECQKLNDVDSRVLFFCHNGKSNNESMSTVQGIVDNASLAQNLVKADVSTYLIDVKWQNADGLKNNAQHASTNETIQKYYLPIFCETDGALNIEDNAIFKVYVPYYDEDGNFTYRDATAEDYVSIYPEAYSKAFSEKYATLESLSSYKGLDTTTIASNLYDVYKGMSDISSTIVSTSSLYTKNDTTYDSNTAVIPSSLSKSVDSLYSISGNVLSSLSNDTQAICNIAEYLYSLDQELCANSSSLTDGTNSLFESLYGSSEFSNFSEELSSLNIELNKIDTSIFKNNVEVGKVGIVRTSELLDTASSLISSLDQEISDTTKTKNSIQDFTSSLGSGNLLGDIWNKVSTCLDNYSNLMDVRKDAAQTLQEALKISTALILNYMDPEAELDDSKLPELRENYTNILNLISELEATIATMVANPYTCTSYTDTNGNPAQSCSGYTSEQIQSSKSTLDGYIATRDELKSDIDKLEGLAPIMDEAQKIVDSAIEAINASYGSCAGSLSEVRQFDFSSDGIKYESIMGEGFDKSIYLNLYDNSLSSYQSQKASDSVDALSTNANANGTVGSASIATDTQSTGSTATAGGSTGSTGGGYTGSGSGSSGGSSGSGSSGSSVSESSETKTESETTNEANSGTSMKTEENNEPNSESSMTSEEKDESGFSNVANEENGGPASGSSMANEKNNKSASGTSNKSASGSSKGSSENNASSGHSKVSSNASSGSSNVNGDNVVISEEPLVNENLNNEIISESEIINSSDKETIDTSVQNEYVETMIEEPVAVSDNVVSDVLEAQDVSASKTTKTLGVASGIGLAVGAAALGATKLLNKKNINEDEDYGFEK